MLTSHPQDLPLQPLNKFSQEPFNPLNSLPLHAWLTSKKPTQDDQERLKMLGNVVAPQCAQLAGSILHHVIMCPEK